ncbi:hypothetical protein [Rhodonellum sp.]|uniref:hypothetical protein n=1 Tax=Rhodonellum sp. TaxID=2231180 RepID=UPI002715FFAF|nr:hypothetical protein [Rhodonellum sp.]MDO9551647.1 hypothetical protein [Rhodonellum sp.]
MKTKVNKIAKAVAMGIFFMALFLNVKFTLENPFITIDNAALAQSSSSSGGGESWICCKSNSEGCGTYDGSMWFDRDYRLFSSSTCP